uniref:Thioredoxin domain-containing protein 17 n=1 Tax=Ascaris lumbricoides TaxID=6252 RepID=A0A0M3HPT3_ASCLU
MVFEKVAVEGYEALKKAIEGSKTRTVILFTGSKDSGKSWCPDCVAAEPVIAKVIGELSGSNFANEHDIRFIECSVGPREYWKDAKNPFRTDDHFKLSCIPTLIEYGVKRSPGD